MLSKRSLKDLMNDENCSCALYERIEEAQRKAKEKQEYFSLAFLDLGHLKEVNACFDYDLADRLLVDVAERLMSCLGSGESLCHFSGDRFIIILNADDSQKAAIKATTILGVIKNTFNILSYQFKISACLGITTYKLEEKSPFKLIREGELALQHAKRKGHNTWSLFNEAMQDSVNINYQIRNELHFAIEKQELWLAYQPLVNVSNLMPVGFETLLRWNKPELNNPPPALFIPPAEENGLIIELGDWVIDQTIQQLKSWEATKQCGKFLSVNVSARQFWDEDFYERIFEKVQYQKIDPSHIEFEITESTAMRDLDKSNQVIKKLNNLGFSIAIDDFGTGYSSLAYLKDLPADKIKIDKHFLLSENDENKIIIEHIVELGKKLGRKVLVEGVETADHHHFLNEINCTYAQGYFYGQPMDIKELDQWQKFFWLFPG